MSQTPLICRLAPQPPRSSSPPSVLRFSVFVWSILGWRDSSSPFWLYPFVLSAADLCFFLSLGPSHCLCSLYFRQIRPAVLHRSLCLLFIVRPSIWVIALFFCAFFVVVVNEPFLFSSCSASVRLQFVEVHSVSLCSCGCTFPCPMSWHSSLCST